ncbi:MAG: putative nucleotidyltransferase substrate binding domain-containing protein [Mycobacterium sp.]
MTPQALDELAASASTHAFSTGGLIVDYSVQVPDEIWMLTDGHVALVATDGGGSEESVDSVTPGGIFGYFPLLTGGRVQFAARATEPSTLIRLPGSLVRAVFANPAGLSFLATAAWDVISSRAPAQQFSLSAVADLLRGEPVLTDADTSVRDAVVHMTAHQVSYVLIPLPDGTFGIFTDRDLRTRVVAAGVDLNAPISSVMSAPARTVTADRAAATVLIDMLEAGLRHLPVLSAQGRVLGVVEETDLVASSTRTSFLLRRAIGLATDRAALRASACQITKLAVDLFRGGTDAAGTSAVLSVVIDAVVRRALELELTAKSAPWHNEFAWLTLGSIARREAMPSSDVDSALSWSDETDADAGLLLGFAANVHAVLDSCGLPADTNGAVASKRMFARSASQWSAAAAGWLDDPLKDRGLILSSLLLDGRVVWGDAALHTVPRAFARMSRDHPNALRLQLLNALAGKVRTRSLRDVVARRGGTFDLKDHALNPIVNLARWAGLTVGVVSASTTARLEAAAGNEMLTDDDVTTLREVFDLLQRLRMAHQVDQIVSGVKPGDIVAMADLSPLNRSLLNDGVREVAAVQRRVRQMASLTAGQGG